ncbi:PepSY domain-containing protein [Polaromonas naphthalenivorans]|uniref:PepSY domain-containing protein n=1 Tax=Polaromonas naphthalenivorans (strain CJ2) TaxID=365044 RepID=A1VLA3_POLNA|nr:PepSY domain-containing protein [Polaromonas naphthalenivorans]ABM36431.1 hypothetical protein Pnap_1115 [Polaromonas naphthalenivorans CJ2]
MKKNHGACAAAVLACGVLLAACGAGVAQASTPNERIVCSTLPGQAWLGEKKIKAIFGVGEYLRVDFKVSRTQCYEFYAIKKNGDVVEAYYHPVTGEIVKRNVILQGPGAASAAHAPASAIGY